MPNMRFLLLTTVLLIFSLGVVMIFNTSSAEVLDHASTRGMHYALIRQMIFAALSLLAAATVWHLGYHNVIRLSLPLLVFFSFLLVLTLIPGIGQERNGARRWVGFGALGLQPSEFVKYIIPVYFVSCMSSFGTTEISIRQFLRVLGVVLIPMLLIMAEPDNGTVAVIGVSLLGLCVITGIPLRYWGWPMLGIIVVAVIAALNMPYVQGRIQVYLNPELDLLGRGHQAFQSKIAAGSGGVFGRGPGMSLQKLSYLPEAQNDYIAAIYAEEFGFVGISFLIGLYMLLVYIGFHIAHQARDRQGYCLAAALTFLICIQAFFNLGVVSGLLPSTGLNLPFFSQGGTSLMVNVVSIAVLLRISQSSEELRHFDL
ncbi:MAG: putative lipid II flippase FtsW [Waddliaceae bacterium]|nr:putative lipid II flippase FtsW [Waddliaceae bacterium]